MQLPVGRFLDALATPGPAPASGSAAALALAQAAALCAKAARLSTRQLPDGRAGQLADEADSIRAAATKLIDEDALGYLAAIERRRAAEPDRPAAAAAALASAADVPMRIVELAVPLAALATELVKSGNRTLRGDAATAILLANAAATSAALLVRIDLENQPADARHARAGELLSQIGQALRSAMS